MADRPLDIDDLPDPERIAPTGPDPGPAAPPSSGPADAARAPQAAPRLDVARPRPLDEGWISIDDPAAADRARAAAETRVVSAGPAQPDDAAEATGEARPEPDAQTAAAEPAHEQHPTAQADGAREHRPLPALIDATRSDGHDHRLASLLTQQTALEREIATAQSELNLWRWGTIFAVAAAAIGAVALVVPVG